MLVGVWGGFIWEGCCSVSITGLALLPKGNSILFSFVLGVCLLGDFGWPWGGRSGMLCSSDIMIYLTGPGRFFSVIVFLLGRKLCGRLWSLGVWELCSVDVGWGVLLSLSGLGVLVWGWYGAGA